MKNGIASLPRNHLLKEFSRNLEGKERPSAGLRRGLDSWPCILWWLGIIYVPNSAKMVVIFNWAPPGIANSFTLYIWGCAEGTCLVTVFLRLLYDSVPGQSRAVFELQRQCYRNAEVRHQFYFRKEDWQREVEGEGVPWTWKNWLDFSWWGMSVYLEAEGSGGCMDRWRGWVGGVGSATMKLANRLNTVPRGRGLRDQARMVEENFTLINFD